jgi:hypothetical protein
VTLRHAAALALLGWYLMVPPIHKSGILTRFWYGQLADWSIVNSFDSAKECEDYREKMVGASRNASKQPPSASEYLPSDVRGLGDGYFYSPSTKKAYRENPTAMCIASDDPRLAK